MKAWLRANPEGRALWAMLEIGDSTSGESGTRLAVRALDAGSVRTFELARTGDHPTTLAVNREEERASRSS